MLRDFGRRILTVPIATRTWRTWGPTASAKRVRWFRGPRSPAGAGAEDENSGDGVRQPRVRQRIRHSSHRHRLRRRGQTELGAFGKSAKRCFSTSTRSARQSIVAWRCRSSEGRPRHKVAKQRGLQPPSINRPGDASHRWSPAAVPCNEHHEVFSRASGQEKRPARFHTHPVSGGRPGVDRNRKGSQSRLHRTKGVARAQPRRSHKAVSMWG